MKHTFAAIAFLLYCPASLATADGPDFWMVKNLAPDDVLNVREEPDWNSNKVGEIPANRGCLVNLGCADGEPSETNETGRYVEGEPPLWCKVKLGTLIGWVAGRYLGEDSECLEMGGEGLGSAEGIPAQILDQVDGTVAGNFDFVDILGTHRLVLAANQSTNGALEIHTLKAIQFLDTGPEWKSEWVIKDRVECEGLDTGAEFFTHLTTFTDLDGDGLVETTVSYALMCRGDVSPDPTKTIMREGADKYAVRGESLVHYGDSESDGGTFKADGSLDKQPAFRDHLISLWKKAAGVVDAPGAQEPIHTVSGDLRVAGAGENGFEVTLDGEVLFELEAPYVNVENLYTFSDADVALVHVDAGGRMTNSYYLIVLREGKTPIVESFSHQGGEEIYPIVDDTHIEIELGHHGNIDKVLVYRNGEVNFVEEEIMEASADEDDCRFLYDDIYVDYVDRRNCGLAPEAVSGLATIRQYDMLAGDPRLDLSEFQGIAGRSCEAGEKIDYDEFAKRVCGAR